MTSDLKNQIEKLMEFFDHNSINYQKIMGDKKAYPNYESYFAIPPTHDIQKWLNAVRSLYQKEHQGIKRVPAIRQVTSGWNIMETHDFLNWLKYYEGNNHLKYKTAQLWYENGDPGYFLHIKPDPPKAPEPAVTGRDIDFAREESALNQEKRQTIERQRNKIIGRLDSAEKLLRSPEGQSFAGTEFEALIEAIYQLKKKIHLVNKLSTSTRLYEDMIVRQANVLARDGFVKAAHWLYSRAQANNPPPMGTGAPGDISVLPAVTPPDNPIAPSFPGAPGGLPSYGPGMPQNAPAETGVPEVGPNDFAPNNLQGVAPQPASDVPASGPASPMPQNDITSPGLVGFLENLDKGMNAGDEAKNDDVLEVSDEALEVKDDDLMVTEAQIAAPPIDEPITTDPAPAPLRPGPPAPRIEEEPKDAPATEESLEVTEDDIAAPSEEVSIDASEFDAKVNAVFSNITVADVVAKLEDIAKIYKTREVPRQLGIIDMMLDSLQLASFFPSLSEATNKALESNNYISTRLEDIISKLRGAMTTREIDLKGEEEATPEAAGIAAKLKADQEKEKARKQQRKEQEVAELEGKKKESPTIELKELGEPLTPAPPPVAR